MGKPYKGNEIIEVLMRRDGMTRHEATAELLQGRKMVLELDYIFDLLL